MPHQPTLQELGQSPEVLADRQAELLAHSRHANDVTFKVATALGELV